MSFKWSFSFLLLFILYACGTDRESVDKEEKDLTMAAAPDSIRYLPGSMPPLPRKEIIKEWYSKKHLVSIDPTTEQLSFFNEDSSFFERNGIQYTGEVQLPYSYKMLTFSYSIKGCPSVCTLFSYFAIVDSSNRLTDNLHVTMYDYSYEIDASILDGNFTLDSTYFTFSEEEGPSGLPDPIGIARTSAKHYRIDNRGKFQETD